MVISIVKNLYQMDTTNRMHDFFVHVLADQSFACQQTELSQKCSILLFGFVFTELFFLFDFVNLHMIRSI